MTALTEVAPSVPEASVPAPSDPAELNAEIVRLRADLQIARQDVVNARHAHERDVRTIGEAVRETADRHEWCGEYDRHVQNLLNSGTLSPIGVEAFREAALREQDYLVSLTITLNVSARVTASDADSAAEIVTDDPSSYIDRYSFDWDNVSDITVDDVEEDY